MRLAISQSNYLPWSGYFKLISNADTFIFYDSVQYTKNDWRNRNKIILNGQAKYLTIPVRYSYSSRLSLNQIKLPDTEWQNQHLNIINMAYGKSKYFELIFPKLEDIIKSEINMLSNLNVKIITYFCEILNITTKLIDQNNFNFNLEKSDRILSKCKEFNADTYITTPKALTYLNIEKFKSENIDIEIVDFDSCLENYDQNSLMFNPYVSILDVLFNEGPKFSAKRLR